MTEVPPALVDPAVEEDAAVAADADTLVDAEPDTAAASTSDVTTDAEAADEEPTAPRD